MNKPQKFIPEAYAKFDKKGKELFKSYLLKNGFQVLDKPEDFNVDMIGYKNGIEYRFEVELSHKLDILTPDNKCTFFHRKAKMKNFYYVKIHIPTNTFFSPHSDDIFKPEFLEKRYYEDKYRKGDELVYAVPLSRLKMNKL